MLVEVKVDKFKKSFTSFLPNFGVILGFAQKSYSIVSVQC